MNVDADAFSRDGYTVVRNVFSAEEIGDLRRRTFAQVDLDRSQGRLYTHPYLPFKYGKGDLLSKPLLQDVILDDRIIGIARQLLPRGPLVYFGDSVYNIGMGARGFHRDNIDQGNMAGPDWNGPYTLLRLGIYLQDHRYRSGGLRIKVGSHLRESGQPILVDSEVGDVVVWNMRTLHSGNAVRLRFWPSFGHLPTVRNLRRFKIGEGDIPMWLQLPQDERIALFMSFGVESAHLDRYINEYLSKADEPRERMKISRFGDEVWQSAERKHLKILRLHPDYGTPEPAQV